MHEAQKFHSLGQENGAKPISALRFPQKISFIAAVAIRAHLENLPFADTFERVKQSGNFLAQENTANVPLSPQLAITINQWIDEHQVDGNEFAHTLLSARGLNSRQIGNQLALSHKRARAIAYSFKNRLCPKAINRYQLMASEVLKPLIDPVLFPQLHPELVRFLRPREKQFLSLLTSKTYKEIAKDESISDKTVRNTLFTAHKTLHCPGQTGAVTLYLLAKKQGLV